MNPLQVLVVFYAAVGIPSFGVLVVIARVAWLTRRDM